MKNWLETREKILAAPVPVHSNRYGVIPHSVFLEEVQDKLTEKGYKVAQERYLTLDNAKLVNGWFMIEDNSDNELCPSISFVNSYNKQRKATIRASAMVLVCKNGMMGTVDNGFYTRKHIGDQALSDFRLHVDGVISGLDEEFRRLVTNKDEMKQIEMDKRLTALLVGDMFVHEGLITPTQLGILKTQIIGSKDFKGNSAWDFYNHVTESLKSNSPINYDRQHIKFHTYMSSKLNLTGNNKLYGEPII